MGYVLLLITSVLTCAGQLCQKQAADSWQKSAQHSVKTTLCWLFFALFFLGVGMLVWLNVLQRLPLSLAYPMLSFNFVLVTLAAQWFFGEKTTLRHWIGIITIMFGILLMSVGQ